MDSSRRNRASHGASTGSAFSVGLVAAVEGLGLVVGHETGEGDGIAVGERIDVGDVAGFGRAHLRYHQHVALAAVLRGVKADDDGVGDLPLTPAVEAPL